VWLDNKGETSNTELCATPRASRNGDQCRLTIVVFHFNFITSLFFFLFGALPPAFERSIVNLVSSSSSSSSSGEHETTTRLASTQNKYKSITSKVWGSSPTAEEYYTGWAKLNDVTLTSLLLAIECVYKIQWFWHLRISSAKQILSRWIRH